MRSSPHRRRTGRRFAAVTTAALALPLVSAGLASAAPGDRATIAGNVPAWATPDRRTGAADPTATLDLRVYLPLRNTAAADQLLRAVSDPASPRYQQYLSAADFRARFAPTDAQVGRVKDFLTKAGLTIADVPDNHHFVEVTGSVDAAQRAFGTRLATFRYAGRTLLAPTGPVSVPADVADIVTAVGGLSQSVLVHPASGAPRDGLPGDASAPPASPPAGAGKASTAVDTASDAPPPPAFVNAGPCSTYYGEKIARDYPKAYGSYQPYAPCGYVPSQLRGAYGVAQAVDHNFRGQGVTIAITDAYAAPTILSDANTYARRRGEPTFNPGQFRQLTPRSYRYGYDDKANGDLCGEQGWYGEETLDVEAAHGMAPGANILYVASRSCDDGDFDAALNKIVDGNLAQIVSDSWGSLGENEPSALLGAYQQTFYQAAIQGIGIYFSSGDGGDESQNTADGQATTDFPASDPLVTAVGGTSLAVNRSNGYQFETGWGTGRSLLDGSQWTPTPPGVFLYGGGGGTSRLFAEPYYQQGVVPDQLATRYGNPGRVVPDVAMDGDPNTGMLVGETQTFPDGSTRYSEYRIGGTSLSCPLFAGVMALTDQVSGIRHGFANPALYSLAGTDAYHDITSRVVNRGVVRVDYRNGVDPSDGTRVSLRSLNYTLSLTARKGYDDVTGNGSPNGATFLTHLGTGRTG